MATILNERDVLLQATVPRYSAPTDRVLLLAASATVFKVSANNLGAPASILFSAALLGMSGAVQFKASNASLLKVNGNSATLDFAGMAGSAVTVTASFTLDNITYASSQTVAKVADGVTGDSMRVCYSKTGLISLSPSPAALVTEGRTSFPPDNTWGAGTIWSSSPQALAEGESLYRSDGVFSPLSGATTWSAPYLNALKVGSLEAVNAKTGSLVVSGKISDAAGNWSVNAAGQALMRAVTILDGNGNVVLASGAAGIDYTKVIGAKPPADATRGAAFGVNIGGQINPANVSTYIADAAIGNAQIGGDIQSTNWAEGTAGWRLQRNGNLEMNNGQFRGTLSAASGTLGTISAGRLQNIANSAYVNLNASGAQPFIYAGEGAIQLNADGSGYFARSIISSPKVEASGVQAVSGKKAGFIGGQAIPFEIYIDTGVNFLAGWNTVASDTFQANATISAGQSTDNGCTGYSTATIAVGDGLTLGTPSPPLDNRIYIHFRWVPAGGRGTISPSEVVWKLVKV